VVGVIVGGGPPVRLGPVVVVMPRADEQDVADDDPAGLRAPRRLVDHRARDVAAAGRDVVVGGPDPEAARVAVEHRAEHGRAVHPRKAHPLDVAARRDERGRLAVGEERVLGDRRER
jgi:hypothetical protein